MRHKTTGSWIKEAAGRLREAGIETPELDARLIVQLALKRDHAGIIACANDPLPQGAAQILESLLRRRSAGEPVSRICGYRHFLDMRLGISPDVLDPRAETELVVELAAADFGALDGLHFCDVGTGSGAIALGLLRRLRTSRCTATDISAPALKIAHENARKQGVANRCTFVVADGLSGLGDPFDFIVSNPPYIATDVIDGLETEVRAHDPRIALDGGTDGLHVIGQILTAAPAHLKPGGKIYVEHGYDQGDACVNLAKKAGLCEARTANDFSGNPRVLVAQKPR